MWDGSRWRFSLLLFFVVFFLASRRNECNGHQAPHRHRFGVTLRSQQVKGNFPVDQAFVCETQTVARFECSCRHSSDLLFVLTFPCGFFVRSGGEIRYGNAAIVCDSPGMESILALRFGPEHRGNDKSTKVGTMVFRVRIETHALCNCDF